jgi:cytochrome oxidase assembly protein ShyY1
MVLSNWQFSRRQEAVAAMTQLAQNYDAKAVPLTELEGPETFHQDNLWHPVTVSGHYLVGNAVLVINRPLNSSPGFLLVVPFQLADGTIVAIERGWVAAGDRYQPPTTLPLPSADEQTVVARVRAAEPVMPEAQTKGRLASINIGELITDQGIKDRAFEKIYLRMDSESKAGLAGKALPKPQLTEGNHLSYALQWILFAIMAAAALIWAVRKELQARAGIVRVVKKDQDSAYEDELLR